MLQLFSSRIRIALLCGLIPLAGCTRSRVMGKQDEQRLKESLQLASQSRTRPERPRQPLPSSVIDFSDPRSNAEAGGWGHAAPSPRRLRRPLPRQPLPIPSDHAGVRSLDNAVRQARYETDQVSDWKDRPLVIRDPNVTQIAALPQPNAKPPLPKPGWQPNRVTLPVDKPPGFDDVRVTGNKEKFSLRVPALPLNTVLAAIAQRYGLNIVVGSDANSTVSVSLTSVTLTEALDSLMAISGCTWTQRGNIIFVSKVKSGSGTNPAVQGRVVRVIPLNYISATDIEKTVKGLLSPAGSVFFNAADPANSRKTQDQIVIEDLPDYVNRCVSYVAQVDQAPRQVLIEAHILQVTLTDDLRHGVNIAYLEEIAGRQLALSTVGFADALSSPATLFSIDGSDMDILVEAIKRTTNAKTLASPKVMVVNGQKAKIQIGERLGYLVATTTETSTLQNVQFLDVGVVMEVTPIITAENKVLMKVKPEISSGQIGIDTGLPSEETTEVDTTVLLDSGRGIVIGGLIQEIDDDRQTKIPLIGDLWAIGRLFQRRGRTKDRTEIIIALVPKIVPAGKHANQFNRTQYERASTRLFENGLDRKYRPWEPNLPDAFRNPRRIRFDRLPRLIDNLRESHPHRPGYYVPPASKNVRVPQRPFRQSQRIVRPAEFGTSHFDTPATVPANNGPIITPAPDSKQQPSFSFPPAPSASDSIPQKP